MDGSRPGALEIEARLAASEAECRRLADELVRARTRIAELEQRLAAAEQAPPRVAARPREPVASATGGASAWDRAVSAMRRERGGRVEPEPVREVRPAARPAPAAAPAPAARPAPAAAPAPAALLAPPPTPAPALSRAAAPAAPTASTSEPRSGGQATAPVGRGAASAGRAPIGDGPCFLDTVERDQRLTEGQREALRSTYLRFVPSAPRHAGSSPTETLSVVDALERDPALSRGQREALRAMLGTLGRK